MLISAHSFLRYQLPVLSWMAFIFKLSSVPGKNVPNLFPYFHHAVHFVEYSVLAFLCMRVVQRNFPEWIYARITAVTMGISIAFAASDEWHQTFVLGRMGQAQTVLFDSLYAGIGVGLFLLITVGRKSRSAE